MNIFLLWHALCCLRQRSALAKEEASAHTKIAPGPALAFRAGENDQPGVTPYGGDVEKSEQSGRYCISGTIPGGKFLLIGVLQMGFLINHVFFLWFASMLLAPFLAAAVSLQGIRKTLRSRKELPLFAEPSPRHWVGITVSMGYLLYSLASQNVVIILLFVLFGTSFLIAPIRTRFEVKHAGLYEHGLLYPEHTTEWKELEAYIEVPGGIRFIHKSSGAFDIPLLRPERERCFPILEKYHVTRKDQ